MLDLAVCPWLGIHTLGPLPCRWPIVKTTLHRHVTLCPCGELSMLSTEEGKQGTGLYAPQKPTQEQPLTLWISHVVDKFPVARGVVGRHWNKEATPFNVVVSWTRSQSFLSIYQRHLLWSVSDLAKTSHGCRQAPVCSTHLGNCYEDKWYISHQISTLAASSGLAERFVQTMKWALCSSEWKASVHECLTNFSLSYWNSLYHWKSISSTANVQPTVGYLLDLLRSSRMTA